MNLLIVAATPFEIIPLIEHLRKNFEKKSTNIYVNNAISVTVLITGVGIHSTIYSLTKQLQNSTYDLIINAGIAGCNIKTKLNKRDVVNIVSDQFGDIGVEEANNTFTDIFELELSNPNQHPFTNGLLINDISDDFDFLPCVKGITVNKVHGNIESIRKFNNKYEYDVESMEGAAFFFVCLQEQQKFLQIRSISNFVEPRNKENWDIHGAIDSLNEILCNVLDIFS